MPNVPYPYEVNWKLVTGNGSLTPICSLSKRSLAPSLTVPAERHAACMELFLAKNGKICNWVLRMVFSFFLKHSEDKN